MKMLGSPIGTLIYALVLVFGSLLVVKARAETLFMFPSTADISISATSTAEFVFTRHRPADWIWIKTHCTDGQSLYFGLLRPRTSYPIRLSASQEFKAPVRVTSVGVSNPGGSACTFSLQGAHK